MSTTETPATGLSISHFAELRKVIDNKLEHLECEIGELKNIFSYALPKAVRESSPGEWRYNGRGAVVTDENARLIGSQGEEERRYYGGYVVCESITDANGPVLAAAKDLLKSAKLSRDALRRAMADIVLHGSPLNSEVLDVIRKAEAEANAAIAKAELRTHAGSEVKP